MESHFQQHLKTNKKRLKKVLFSRQQQQQQQESLKIVTHAKLKEKIIIIVQHAINYMSSVRQRKGKYLRFFVCAVASSRFFTVRSVGVQ